MFNHSYTYQAALASSETVRWRIEDIIGGEKRLDFSKPFMPESFARVQELTFLNDEEKLLLNQIRGNAYLCIFGLVEEFILPFVIDHARQQVHGDDYPMRAFLQFAGEEAKHIQLFKRFQREFEEGFGTHCPVIGPAQAIADAISETGATSPKDMGRVMKAVMSALAGKSIDGKAVNELVRKKLAG